MLDHRVLLMSSIISSALSQITILEAVQQVPISTKATVRQYNVTKWKLNGRTFFPSLINVFVRSLHRRLETFVLFPSTRVGQFVRNGKNHPPELAQVARTQTSFRNVNIMRADDMLLAQERQQLTQNGPQSSINGSRSNRHGLTALEQCPEFRSQLFKEKTFKTFQKKRDFGKGGQNLITFLNITKRVE
uniref:AlNc14C71G4877 protein n=2 Tax=Albugo laibachii Nc14 TaxID=890382 RepID=F0WE13_9STRA|nr:AlNc14C71G4877 [Albugo laibachii Nc14]|eukprot:CCA19442.1 AlNc14C71G4877 [Albugo laibachii Nc14]